MSRKLSRKQLSNLIEAFKAERGIGSEQEVVATFSKTTLNDQLASLSASTRHACIITRGGNTVPGCCMLTTEACQDLNGVLQGVNPEYHAEPGGDRCWTGAVCTY